MKQINTNKYLVGKKKLGKGKVGARGGVGVPTGASEENPSSTRKSLTSLSNLS